MRYFAIVADEGIVVRAAESLDQLQYPHLWREVGDIRRHANERGMDALHAGKRMVFHNHDQSYPALMALFA